MSDVIGRDYNCPYASNSYHDCTEICFKKVSEKIQNEGHEPVQDKGMKKAQRKGVTPIFLKPLRSFNSHARNFFSINLATYQGRTNKMLLISDSNDVHSNCKHASNPYHKCAEYCFSNIPNWNQPNQVMKLNSLEGDKAFNLRGRTSLQSQCIYASNPRHEYSEVCFQNGQDENTHDGENSIDVSTSTDKNSLLPYHKDVECCIENTPEQKHPHKALNPKEEIKTLEASEFGVKVECKNASPYHIDDEKICFQNLFDDLDLKAVMKAKEEIEVIDIPQREANLSCESMSHPYIEYCFKNVPEKDKLGLEEDKIALTRKVWVNPECQFALNPYHACAEYCFENATERERHRNDKKLRSLRKIFSNKETTSVHSQCAFASNPYHECGTYCIQNKHNQNKAKGASMKLKENKEVHGERGVDPKCQFTSNPYHVCDEYCIQNVTERKKHGHESKEGKKETSHALRRDVNSKCKFTSSPSNKCSEYCFEGRQDKNQPVECIPVITKERMRHSRSEKRCHLILDKLDFVEATKLTYSNVESSIGIIFPDRMDKISKDSKFVEASNPDTDYDEFSKGITMQIVTENLIPDVQPLQLDASHLFLEWVKYCSQEKTAEHKIVVQERRGFETKNGQDNNNFNFYNSSILEKFKAEGSLQCSLPTAVLFFLGFLFALFNGHK